jgi:hypothetical protein
MKKVSRAVRAKKVENVYVDKNRYLGLCSYCKSASNCTFTRDPNRPVCECEEFDQFTYAPVGIPNQKNISLKHFPQNPSTREDPFHHYRGLCSDCEERATCAYPKPEGGVWHCEEFRQ